MAAAESSLKNKAIEDISWLDAEKEYALGVHQGKLVCRNPKGKKLSAVPKWLKETELAEQLLALCEWLADHEMECQHRIETWMLRSLPVPRDAVEAVWAEPLLHPLAFQFVECRTELLQVGWWLHRGEIMFNGKHANERGGVVGRIKQVPQSFPGRGLEFTSWW